jgi:hypothetical protein
MNPMSVMADSLRDMDARDTPTLAMDLMERAADEIARLAAVNAELLAALKALIEPFATVTDETLRDYYPDTPQPRNILAARAAIRRAEGKDAP